VDRQRYDEYIRRFNEQDFTAFDDFLTPDMQMQNGGLRYSGVQGMKDHYAKIWGKLKETLTVKRFVSDEACLAVHLHARFDVLVDDPAALFGSVRRGEIFEYDGVIMYQIQGGKFSDIKVAYLSFNRTDLNGVTHSLGLAH
jgi:SnoaL-like domain